MLPRFLKKKQNSKIACWCYIECLPSLENPKMKKGPQCHKCHECWHVFQRSGRSKRSLAERRHVEGEIGSVQNKKTELGTTKDRKPLACFCPLPSSFMFFHFSPVGPCCSVPNFCFVCPCLLFFLFHCLPDLLQPRSSGSCGRLWPIQLWPIHFWPIHFCVVAYGVVGVLPPPSRTPNAHIRALALPNTTNKPREDSRETNRGKKKREILGPPPFVAPPSKAPPSQKPEPKMEKPKIGEIRMAKTGLAKVALRRTDSELHLRWTPEISRSVFLPTLFFVFIFLQFPRSSVELRLVSARFNH